MKIEYYQEILNIQKKKHFGKFIQFQPETKTLIRKLERILIKLYRQNVSLYMCVCVCVCVWVKLKKYIYN